MGSAPPHTPICTTSEAHVLRVMHAKFGQNWPKIFRGKLTEGSCELKTNNQSLTSFLSGKVIKSKAKVYMHSESYLFIYFIPGIVG